MKILPNIMSKLVKKDNTIIEVKDGKIPYNEVDKQDKITFIIITQDDEVLQKSIKSIAELHKEHKDKEFNVVISSSYDKLHKITKGML